MELFGLSGSVELVGQRLGPGCYAYVPSGARDAALQASEDADVERDGAGRAPARAGGLDRARRPAFDPVAHADENPNRALGAVIKRCREDLVTKDWTWLSAVVSGRVGMSRRAEVHPAIREAFMLRETSCSEIAA